MRSIQQWISLTLCAFLFIGIVATLPLSANTANETSVPIEIVQEENTAQPGRPFWVAVRIQVPPSWHTYWKNPGETGMPLTIDWQLPKGWEAGPIYWPTPEKFTSDAAIGYGYSGETFLLAQLTPPKEAPLGVAETIGADIRWLICSDTNCLPGESHADLAIALSPNTPTPHEAHKTTFNTMRAKLPEKNDAVHATRSEGRITLRGNGLPLVQPHEVVFIPEGEDPTDPTAATLETYHDSDANETAIVLKDLPHKAHLEEIKGVLVLGNQKSLEISSLLQQENAIGTIDRAGISVAEESFAWILILAFAGGMLLNLMPCVLPVLSFKVMSFMKMSGQSRSLTLKHGLFFSLGVLLSFWTLAGVMLTLQAYGSAVGWGFQLQDPLFVAILAGVLFVFSLSLFGVFELGTSVASIAGQGQVSAKQTGYLSSFLSGVLATAIATPCTGPFLGTAVGFAFTVAAPKAMLVFTFLGAGMAFPYLLLAAFPKLLRFMPKPGTWMVVFKEIMGFLLLATVLWLIWVFGAETNLSAVVVLMVAFLAFAVGSWIYGKFSTPMSKKLSRNLAYLFTGFFFLAGSYLTYTSTTDEWAGGSENGIITQADRSHGWTPFSPEKVEELRQAGTPVLIDFTAEWCLSCKANHIVLSAPSVEQAFKDKGVVKMKADWTKRDPIVTEALRQYGRNSIPLYVLYTSNHKEPQILPQVLTPDIVIQAVKNPS